MSRIVLPAAALLVLSAAAVAQSPASPAGTSAPTSPVADTVWQPAQGNAAAPTPRAEPRGEPTDAGPRDGAPGQAHETHGTPNPRNPDPR